MSIICAPHAQAVKALTGAMVTFKLAMETRTMDAWAMSTDVSDAVSELRNAASADHVPTTPALQRYLSDLQDLDDAVIHPPASPSAEAGDKDFAI